MPLKHRVGREFKLYSFFNVGARWGSMISATPRSLGLRETVPGTHCTGGWVGPRPVWTGVEKGKCLVDTEVRTSNRAARSESLYRLLNPGPVLQVNDHVRTYREANLSD
jgi:hypothetical protein